jgi:tetratricopeptide (TPR) repeat protein
MPMLAWLLSQPAAVVDVRNGVGATACHAAAGNDAAAALQALLAAGADISARDESGDTPRDVASRLKRPAAIAVLDTAAQRGAAGDAHAPTAPAAPAAAATPVASAGASIGGTTHGAALAAATQRHAAPSPPAAAGAARSTTAVQDAPAVVSPAAAHESVQTAHAAEAGRAAAPAAAAASAPSSSTDAVAALEAQAEEALPDVGCVAKDTGRAWLEAARRGDVDVLRQMLAAAPSLLYYWGTGTNFGFTGHSALHWAAAKGHAPVLRVLLQAGAHPDVPNNGGARALHAAAANGQVECARILLLEGSANATLRNGLDETARELAAQSGHAEAAAAIETAARAAVLRDLLSADASLPGAPAIRAAQAALTAAGHDVRGLTERADVLAAARQLVASLPPLARQPVDRVPVPPPKPAAQAQQQLPPAAAPLAALAQPAVSEAMSDAAAQKAHAHAQAPAAAACSDADSDDDGQGAPAAAAATKQHAEAAKARGNVAFAAGQFSRAVMAYSIALRFDRGNAVLLSNRSAAHAAAGNFAGALEDADRAVRATPRWGKAHARRGAALLGLGQAGEAVKAYLAGLAAEPGAEYLREGLAEAKQAIRDAQARYTEMWGEQHPGVATDDA